ncbi:uncharacterized protein Dwil_GK27043, partial [Drosophila willistoni]
MGKGTVLSLVEKSKIEAYFESGLSYLKIAEKTGRHRKAIANCMVWGAISYCGTCELQFLTSRMNAQDYNNVLKTAFPHFQNVFQNLQWTFQHDNMPIHTARSVKSWIQGQKIDLMEWPPYSPDLNIIENVWG